MQTDVEPAGGPLRSLCQLPVSGPPGRQRCGARGVVGVLFLNVAKGRVLAAGLGGGVEGEGVVSLVTDSGEGSKSQAPSRREYAT